MDEPQLLALKPELDRFLDRFAALFGRDENQAHARRFVQGLLHGGERRNAENIAQATSGGPVRSLQAFLTTGTWLDTAVLDELRRSVLEVLADDDAVWNSDETGFPKKGAKSVGVKRQYSGTLGRTDNCQVAVFANYCSANGHTFMDRRLFLPEEWAGDRDRREQAGVPPGVIFRTKPQLALEMVAAAVAEGVPFRWVGGDGVYGDSPTFVQGVRQLAKLYVLDSSADARVWTAEPRVIPPEQRPRPSRGRPPTQPLVIGEASRVDEVVAALPAGAWRRLTVAEGSQGPRVYEYAEVWAWFSEEGLPGPRERLLVRRSLGQEPELKYHRSNAPAEMPLLKLAQVRATRWTIEEDIKSGKGQCGLDEYETRGWSGWHHHTALSMLALAFLVLQRRRLGEKRAGDDRARGKGSAHPPARGARLGRGRDPQMVGLAPGEESPSGGQPSPTALRRAKTTPTK
ncbi:MAG TPA: IS701 family transposase [Isosphaeraceae bacterium]|jgi:SRSO17 transposase